ncbi:uncharacterized protein LOC110733164 [Chenopodium quinoa]|uniref:uncharacterized protein LOC110733164 n=1 Tax=Chenopodium quinoa TaxID=63459 RepID=UPI000B78C47E|nr:uncharacterized protein LOC110733164 [Chenopodium quinoa]
MQTFGQQMQEIRAQNNMVDSQLAQLAERTPFNSPSTLPGQPQPNPSHNSIPDTCKAITLRSGTSYEGPNEGGNEERKGGEESVNEVNRGEKEKVDEIEGGSEKKKLDNEKKTSIPSEVRNLDGPVTFPGRLAKRKLNDKFAKFLSVTKNLHINLPFIEVVTQMPSYSKFLKDILTNKRKLNDELITLPHQVMMDMEEDVNTPLVLSSEDLKTLGAVINCKNNTITCEVADEKIVFEFSKLLKTLMVEKCYRVDVVSDKLDRLGRVMMKPQEAKEFVMAIEES